MIRIKCKYCSKEIAKNSINRHEQSCKLNPINIKKCLNCDKILLNKESKLFCSHKCSASYNNKKRKLSKYTKNKISKSIKNKNIIPWNKGKYKYNIQCIICKKIFHRKGKYCSLKCMGIARKSKSWSILQKELYKTGKQHIGGGRTKWYKYKNIKVQGTYELRVCKILDFWKDSNKIKSWEYTNDRFPYLGFDKKEHTYLIDFKITNLNNTIFYIEVKGYKTDIDELKWDSLKKLGYTLLIWYNDNITIEENQMPH